VAAASITLRIVLEQPPPGVAYAVQKGKGAIYDTILKHSADGGDLTFEFAVEVRGERGKGEPDFGGPLVQGPRGGRFVYLDVGKYAGQATGAWGGRIKVPLTGITWRMTQASVLVAHVPGRGRDGGPSFATVRDFEGWLPA